MARYLGIEVTEGQVKGVVIRAAYRVLQIDAVFRFQRPAPGPEGLTASVEAIVREAGAVDAAYAAIPGTEASMRILELPKAVLRRGGRVIATELEGSLPYDVEQATVDAQTIRSGDQIELLAVATRTERLKSFVEALKAGGADPREVGVGPIAIGDLAQVLPELAVPGPVLVVHAYETHADFTVLASGVVQMARTLSAQTTPAARERGIRQTLGAYLAGGGTPPVVAYLCGDQAFHNMDVVADAASLGAEQIRMGLPIAPFTASPAMPDPNELQYAPLAFALATRGLGRHPRIDLRKGDLAVSSSGAVFRERGLLLAGLAAALISSWGMATYSRYYSISQERDRLRVALGRVTLDAFGERVNDPRRAKALATGNTPDADTDPMPLSDAFDVVGVLSARIPESVHHDINSLDVADERVEIQGIVDTLADRDQIVEQLGHYECFQNIQAGRAQRNAGDNRQQYTLNIELRCPERQNATNRRGTGTRPAGSTGSGSSGGSQSSGGGSGSGA
jgi:general secretion pathway protein L